MHRKIKVVWICHFSTDEIRQRLGVNRKVKEFAPWISIGIREAKKRDDIELHVVAPYEWLSECKEFNDKNIYYHFVNTGIPFLGRHWPRFFRFDLWTRFFCNRKKIVKFVDQIKPDIVHLHGMENPYYSSAILDLYNKYKIISTVQGFISESQNSNINKNIRVSIEISIIKKLSNFGVRNSYMKDVIKRFNKKPVFYDHEYFINSTSDYKFNKKYNGKKYELIYFARISKDKGVEDFIKVVSLLKDVYSNFNSVIIGNGSSQYVNELKLLADKLNCIRNIDFLGFLPNQKDVYQVLKNSKICLLPTYNDIIPGTIIESMFNRVPVVTYYTGGIPEINAEFKCIEIVEQGNIEMLVESITILLENENYRNQMVDLAANYASERWSNDRTMSRLIDIYHEILVKDEK